MQSAILNAMLLAMGLLSNYCSCHSVSVDAAISRGSKKMRVFIDGQFISPHDRVPQNGEVILPRHGNMVRLKGTIKWEQDDPPEAVEIIIWTNWPPRTAMKASEGRGRIVRIESGFRKGTGAAEWEGDIKANWGESDTYYVEIRPRKARFAHYKDELGHIISWTQKIRVR